MGTGQWSKPDAGSLRVQVMIEGSACPREGSAVAVGPGVTAWFRVRSFVISVDHPAECDGVGVDGNLIGDTASRLEPIAPAKRNRDVTQMGRLAWTSCTLGIPGPSHVSYRRWSRLSDTGARHSRSDPMPVFASVPKSSVFEQMGAA